MESIKVFEADELASTKARLTSFLTEIALQLRSRLPENINILKKVHAFSARNLLNNSNSQAISEVAAHFRTFGRNGINMSAVEIELRRLRHTSLPLEVTGATPLIEFWTEIAKFKSGGSLPFPHLTQLASILLCLPISNATVERLFSVMGVVKSKL